MRRLWLVALLVASCLVGGQTEGRNRLAGASSPYLRQHADNPVDWYPWGEEAFAAARAENKPIFLSIGYSTCHWCHVMERECFMDPQLAAVLNRDFIAIKVDREERPDVDRVYMQFLLSVQPSGGWPMSVFLTPDLKPFFGGTYFPPHARDGLPGFDEVLARVHQLWTEQPEKVQSAAAEMLDELRDQARSLPGPEPRSEWSGRGERALAASYDLQYGGFGMAPKFPRPVNLTFLLERGQSEMVVATLKAMARGGIHDQLEGGFHRYSTDRFWRVPHFEKMLYDQALLAECYSQAYALTSDPELAGVAADTLDYCLARLGSPEGAFYCAEDADEDFYRWTPDQLAQAEVPPSVAQDGVLTELGSSEARHKLLEARNRRPRPAVDTKVLCSWNGMMIAALAQAGRYLERPDYLEAAERCLGSLREHLYEDGNLLHQQGVPAFCEDYAELIHGLLELHQATQKPEYLRLAFELQARQDELFWDADQGGYFETGPDQQHLLVRTKDRFDAATWTANSRSAQNLVRLAQLADDPAYAQRATQLFAAFAGVIERDPTALPGLLTAFDLSRSPHQQVVIAGPGAAPMLREALAGYAPHRTVLWADDGPNQRLLEQRLDFLKSVRPKQPTAYLCTGFVCGPPIESLKELRAILRRDP
ncbi:MAG: thioredoxin domain-containing protein [Candidatus Eremiobacteraeota bacterium]|nr:thioredoxin domain-containing protein [Candidatus Eremiobacteraeota bacterium]